MNETTHLNSNHVRSALLRSVETVAQAWRVSPYYQNAEEWTYLFWSTDSAFRQLHTKLNLSNAVELACGHGRHAERCSHLCGTLTLVDIFPAHLDKCRERLVGKSNVRFLLGNGYDFSGIPDASVTAIYSYDAMVHFAPDMMQSYLNDAARILAPGGMALLHHSNHAALPGIVHYGQNPHARNHMTYELFGDLAQRAGLTILESHTIAWGGVADLDRISLLARPS